MFCNDPFPKEDITNFTISATVSLTALLVNSSVRTNLFSIHYRFCCIHKECPALPGIPRFSFVSCHKSENLDIVCNE
ncbi:hypothetical protein BpHYR1_045076 [Brachionus plicatilis]|uniref:Uncharacterized protein n=1 Tax=Brachionus plicatilis TaxID=10195 RepID=A0A3M7SL05_BRAPC|nr:hypothetical protein BpHYR1_045076 [Brachionus plicatilis]